MASSVVSRFPDEIRLSFGLLGHYTGQISDEGKPSKKCVSPRESATAQKANELVARWIFGASQVIPDVIFLNYCAALIRFPIYLMEIYNCTSHVQAYTNVNDASEVRSRALQALASIARLVMMVSCPIFLIQIDMLATLTNKILPEFLHNLDHKQFSSQWVKAFSTIAPLLNAAAT